MKQLVVFIRILTLLSAFFGTLTRIILATRGETGLSVLFYFTVQSNLMVFGLLAYDSINQTILSKKLKFPHPSLFGAVAMYITATGIIYNILLAPSLDASGLNALVLLINHTITPLLYLIFWLLLQTESQYKIRYAIYWIFFPVIYAIFGSIEGFITGTFRYFFLDFTTRPFNEYIITLVVMVVFFIVLGGILLLLNHLIYSTRSTNQ